MNNMTTRDTAFGRAKFEEVRRLYRAGRARGLRALDILSRIYRAELPTVRGRALTDTMRRFCGYDDVSKPPPPVLLTHPRADDVRITQELTINLPDDFDASSLASAIRAAIARDVQQACAGLRNIRR